MTLQTIPAILYDSRLTQRGVTLIQPRDVVGPCWRIIRADYLDKEQADGKRNILVEVLDAYGQRQYDVPVDFWWADGDFITKTRPNDGYPWTCDYPMTATGNSYGCKIADGPSDSMFGFGLGTIEAPDYAIHVAFSIVFQRIISGTTTLPPLDLRTWLPTISTGPQALTPPTRGD
jgi:hypothetical protein